ncbi:MAG TPA: TolC family protein [Verrucomicrobiae bacterium]|nr:TolC family protein [Verrucomicrobiae bacterium]
MGHLFGLIDIAMSRGRLAARQGGSCPSIGRFSVIALGLAIALVLPISRAAAQATSPAPSGESEVQLLKPSGPGQAAPPTTVTLQDALERARKLDPTLLGATSDARSAREDRIQARNAMLPTITATTQYLGTQGNGGRVSDGRFVTNDGIHVYRLWGVYHQDLSPGLLMGTAYTRTKAAEAIANAKAEIARRGLAVTVTKNYYGMVVAQRKYATAQAGLDQAKHFMDITQDLEHQGQAPHSDGLKAEIQYRIQKQAFDEAKFSMEDTRLGLAVILFPDFNENFTVVDDLDSAPALPPFPEVQEMAEKQNPDMRVARETLHEADLDVKLAKTAFLPTLTVDTDYGIEANCFALRCARAAFPEIGVLPNLGYFLTAALTVPVWDWGTLRSKLHQAEFKQQSAKAALSLATRTDVSELYATYDEALIARSGLEEARTTAELAAESLRLTNLRYSGGAAPASDVVDAETALVTARNAYADAQVRYRMLLANLQTFTGSF